MASTTLFNSLLKNKPQRLLVIRMNLIFEIVPTNIKNKNKITRMIVNLRLAQNLKQLFLEYVLKT